MARLGLAEGGASGLAILFSGGAPVAVSAEGGVEVSAPSSWDEVRPPGSTRRRSSRCARGACSTPATMPPSTSSFEAPARRPSSTPRTTWRAPAAWPGYEQPLRVTGSATVGDARLAIDGLGQRGHSWGAPDWERIELARTISAWLGDDLAVSLTAIRPAGKRDHAAEAVAASSSSAASDGDARRSRWPTPVCRPPTTATVASAARASSYGSTRTAGRAARPARSRVARRWTSGACAWTAPSSAGAWRAARASGATTSSAPRRQRGSVLGAQPVPEVQLEALAGELSSSAPARGAAAPCRGPAPRRRRRRRPPRRGSRRRSSAPRGGCRPAPEKTLTRNSRLAIGWPTSSEACHAASIERSSSSRSATALA